MNVFSTIVRSLTRFLREEDAPTMAEYGLLLVVIGLIVVVGAGTLGIAINTVLFSGVANAIPGSGS